MSFTLNNDGFDSTLDLRERFYKEYSKYKNQTNRTFNRYFKKFRDDVNMSQYKLKIVRSSVRLQGFYTEENTDFKPKD